MTRYLRLFPVLALLPWLVACERLKIYWAVVLVVVPLGACTSLGIGRGPDLADALGDELVMEADTGPERALRLAAVNAILSDLLTDRAVDDPSEAAQALAALDRLAAAGLRADPSNPWLYTELWEARRALLSAIAPAAKQRAVQVLKAAVGASGGSYMAALKTSVQLAGRGSKLAAMGRDVDALVGRVQAGTLPEIQARALLAARVDDNRRRLRQLVELAR